MIGCRAFQSRSGWVQVNNQWRRLMELSCRVSIMMSSKG
jgi:hypothetical protein